jgi:hypothetical protein
MTTFMSKSMDHLHTRYIEGMSVAALGGGTLAIDLLKSGTVLLGFLGACLAALGGWEAWRAKRLERQLRQIELRDVKEHHVHEKQ